MTEPIGLSRVYSCLRSSGRLFSRPSSLLAAALRRRLIRALTGDMAARSAVGPAAQLALLPVRQSRGHTARRAGREPRRSYRTGLTDPDSQGRTGPHTELGRLLSSRRHGLLDLPGSARNTGRARTGRVFDRRRRDLHDPAAGRRRVLAGRRAQRHRRGLVRNDQRRDAATQGLAGLPPAIHRNVPPGRLIRPTRLPPEAARPAG